MTTSTAPIENPLLTEDEAALYLRVSPRTLQRWRLARRIGCRMVGSRPLYRSADLEAFLEACAQPALPPRKVPAGSVRPGGRTARRRAG